MQLETEIGYRTSELIDWEYFGIMGAKFGGVDDLRGYTFLKYVKFDFSNKNNILKKVGGLLLSDTVPIVDLT